MNTTRIAVISAAAAVVAWAVKGVAIGLAGGLDKSPFEGPFFLLGLICFVVAVCSLALSVLGRREMWARAATVAGSLLAVVVGVVLSGFAVDTLATSDHWVWSEMSLWLVSLAVLAAAARHSSRPRPHQQLA